MDDLYRINVARGSVVAEKLNEEYRYLGGRGLCAAVLKNEVDARTDPFGPDNKCIVAPGFLAGTAAPCAGRLSVGGKSPLTGTIKEANSGGTAAYKLGRLGVRGLILEGPAPPGLKILKIDRQGVSILPGESLKGMGNYKCTAELKARFGRNCATITVGPAGEHGYLNSTIAVSDMDGIPTRQAARGGLGALMASKGVKGIVVDDRGARGRRVEQPQEFKRSCKALATMLVDTKQAIRRYGTSIVMNPVNAVGGLPTRNFSQGQFDEVGAICGEALHETISARRGQGKTAHICSPGCVIACSNVFADASGRRIVSSLEYETLALMGSNLDIASLDEIARLNYKCNDYGLDTIETGVSLGIAMEAGLLSFGDAEAALNMVDEIGHGSLMGKVLGNGARMAGTVLGCRRIPEVKGQALPAYDPRSLKGTGTTCAMTPMGADHTAGNLLPGRGGLDCTQPRGQIELSLTTQILATVMDTLGFCIMMGVEPSPTSHFADILAGITGEAWTESKILALGRHVLKMEHRFNRQAGFTPAHDRLPAFFEREQLPPFGRVYDVSYAAQEAAKQRFLAQEGDAAYAI